MKTLTGSRPIQSNKSTHFSPQLVHSEIEIINRNHRKIHKNIHQTWTRVTTKYKKKNTKRNALFKNDEKVFSRIVI